MPATSDVHPATPGQADLAASKNGASKNARADKPTTAGLWIALVFTLIPLVCLAVPMYVIRPFRPQDPAQLAAALEIRDLGPWLSAIAAVVVAAITLWAWKRTISLWRKIAFASLCMLATAGACATHINIFEIMFHPYASPDFGPAESAAIDATDKVLAVKVGDDSHAYPIRTMGYHHIVNDTVGGLPIAATYCTLCHAGLVWSRQLDGLVLTFRLAGINNGNALMRDEQTNTIWQQSTGQGIFGSLKGRQLVLVHSDELTFSLWRAEQPHGLVLKPDAPYASEYEVKDWETHIEKTHTVIDTSRTGIAPHELMLGVSIAGEDKAYPIKAILAAKAVQDQVAGVPILIVVGPDNASIRVFKIRSGDPPITFLPALLPGDGSVMRDAGTGSRWNFQGCAIDGKQAGQCLAPADSSKDYWFDWMNHHPRTEIFRS